MMFASSFLSTSPVESQRLSSQWQMAPPMPPQMQQAERQAQQQSKQAKKKQTKSRGEEATLQVFAPPSPTASDEAGASSIKETRMLDKTKLCKFFASSRCRRGAACPFAHGKRELRAQPDLFRTEICHSFTSTGACRFGDACRFAHSSADIRAPEGPAAPAAGEATPRSPQGAAAPASKTAAQGAGGAAVAPAPAKEERSSTKRLTAQSLSSNATTAFAFARSTSRRSSWADSVSDAGSTIGFGSESHDDDVASSMGESWSFASTPKANTTTAAATKDTRPRFMELDFDFELNEESEARLEEADALRPREKGDKLVVTTKGTFIQVIVESPNGGGASRRSRSTEPGF